MTEPWKGVEAEAQAVAETKALLGHRHYAARDAIRRAIAHGRKLAAVECIRLAEHYNALAKSRPDGDERTELFGRAIGCAHAADSIRALPTGEGE